MVQETHVRTYELSSCWVHEHDCFVHTVFKQDRSSSVFAPPRDPQGKVYPDFVAIASGLGYSNIMRYAVEHEIAHQLVAEHSGEPSSYVVWSDAHGDTSALESDIAASEEHLANRFQRWIQLGIPDEYGVLESTFGDGLSRLSALFLSIARPWLRLEIHNKAA